MRRLGFTIAMLAGATASPASAQLIEPETNLDVVINGLFELCPGLISGAIGPDFDPAPYAMAVSDRRPSMWESTLQDGLAFLIFEPADRQCAVNFSGPERAKQVITQVVHGAMTGNGFSELEVENPTEHPGNVHVRLTEDSLRREQYVTVFHPELLTITYTEKANF